jgi:nucleotide-binding universal stress UspA family protein
MKAILLPTDFSKISINAIHYAINMFQNESCDFYLLNVQKASSFISDDMMVMSSSTTIYETLISASKKSIENIIIKIKDKYDNNNHRFHSIVDYDDLIDSINQVCKIHHIDLIVMGTKGASGLESVIFGSNTVHAMQRCHVPILAIPDKCIYSNLHEITLTTSYKNLYSIEDIQPLKNLIEAHQSHLSILHVKCDFDFAEELDKDIDFFKSHFLNLSFKNIHSSSGDIFKDISEYITINDVRMIVMVNKKHSFFERFFTKHLVEVFGFKLHIPFLVINKKENLT